MDWTTDAFILDLQQQAAAERGVKWQNSSHLDMRPQLISGLRRALGKLPEHHRALQPRLLERKEYDDFYLERITYSTMDHVHVPVLVLIPKEREREEASANVGDKPEAQVKDLTVQTEGSSEVVNAKSKAKERSIANPRAKAWPAVLACHGHGSGQYEAIGMNQDGQLLDNRGIHNQFAVELVRKGLLVVIPEVMGFGVRRIARDYKDATLYNSCASLSSSLLMHGRTLAGMRVYEAMRAIDYIQSRNDVLEDNIGIYGLSGGSLIGAYTAALDERVKATVLCGWTNTYSDSILSIRHCIDNYLPGLLLEAEQPELMGLLAPRPLFIEAGEQDHIFPIDAAKQAIATLQAIYDEYQARNQLASHIHEGGHEICGTRSFQWLADKLAFAASIGDQ